MTVTRQRAANIHFTANECVSLIALSSSPATARVFVRSVLERWHCTRCIDVAQLLASELVTNAIKAVGMVDAYPALKYTDLIKVGTVSLCLYRQGELIVMEVWDRSDKPPMPIAAGPDDTSGRGLAIVMALAEGYGYRRPKTRLGGKVVWCSIKAK